MKKISVCVCCYNEVENVKIMYNTLSDIMNSLNKYDYEIIFSDNDSNDGTQDILRSIADADSRVKVIFNINNYGPARSGRNCIFSASGDAVIAIPCDLQEPPEMIPAFVSEWEKGHKIVWGQKQGSNEGKIKYKLRDIYYTIIEKCSDYKQIRQTTGFGIMDCSVVDIIKNMHEPEKSFRHIIAELGYPVKLIPYVQNKRERGKSSFNIKRWMDFSIKSLVNTSKKPIRLFLLFGIFLSCLSCFSTLIMIIFELLNVFDVSYVVYLFSLIIFLDGFILTAIGFVGEYLLQLIIKNDNKPYVIEKQRLNF